MYKVFDNKLINIFILSIALFDADLRAGEVDFSSEKVNETVMLLKQLKPLQKVHYSWHIPNELLEINSDDRLFEYARITHAISLRGETLTQNQMDTAVRVCHKVNAIRVEIKCTLAVNYSPWHRRFGKDLPATDFGKTYKDELNLYGSRLEYVKKALKKSNSKYNADISLSAVLLDSERFHVLSKNNGVNISISKRHGVVRNIDEWNAAITKKHSEIYNLTIKIFPGVRIEQYERGAWMRSASKDGWMRAQWYALDEPGDSYSVSLYRIVELGNTRETFRRTAESAKEKGILEVTPYVALGSGQKRQTDTFHRWGAWDYDLVYSWQIGSELNNKWYGDRPERFAPWNVAKVVVFFPSPFSNRYPAWIKHFIAYVRGANGSKELADLES